MGTRIKSNAISSEVLAACLEGNTTAFETRAVFESLAYDEELRELVRISQEVDEELGMQAFDTEILPMTALAASCEEGAYCCLECEKYVLRDMDIAFDEDHMMAQAVRNGWHKENGTPLHNVGRHLEEKGLVVSRRFKATVADIVASLNDDDRVIVALDGGELLGCRADEAMEDLIVGQIPDHTVVVLSVDSMNGIVKVYDPNSISAEDVYPIDVFEDAWDDSRNYLVTVARKDAKPYRPQPIDISDVELPDELNELREAIAENAHDVWAAERQAQGWTYGPKRDDAKKETPCMVAYSQLPDSEKKFDRDMAMNTLKLLKKLGYDLVRRGRE